MSTLVPYMMKEVLRDMEMHLGRTRERRAGARCPEVPAEADLIKQEPEPSPVRLEPPLREESEQGRKKNKRRKQKRGGRKAR